MHDGISKFSKEYNGIYVRGLNLSSTPFNVPMELRKMKGSVDAHNLAQDLIDFISGFSLDGKVAAYISLIKHFDDDDHSAIPDNPPCCTKLGTLVHVDGGGDDEVIVEEEYKNIHINVTNMPVGNCGDGVAVNGKAARVMSELYGIHTPSLRCSVHAAYGSLKRMARSETMSVEAVKTCYESLRPIVNHFSLSPLSKEVLDESLRILELKPIHLLSWCNTRMAHFLDACVRFDEIIVGVHDSLYSTDKKKD